MAKTLTATDKVLSKLTDLRKTLRGEQREVLDKIVLSASFPVASEVEGHQMVSSGAAMKSCQLVNSAYIFKD